LTTGAITPPGGGAGFVFRAILPASVSRVLMRVFPFERHNEGRFHMSLFTVTTKLWPTGDSLDTGTDDNIVSVPPGSASFDRHAALYVTSPDGTQNYEFLFWNTGRHVTNKRHVHWDFTAGGWTTWTATRWYGLPSNGNGGHEVRVDPFSIADNGPMSGTAIDASASNFPAGAYPDMGDDHLIDTEDGAVDVAAKGLLSSEQFAGWDQLIWGGDDSGTFYENDTGAAQGTPNFYPVGSGTFHVATDGSASLLALYGNSVTPKYIKESLKSEVDVMKSFVSDFPKLKDNEGDPWQRYAGDPAWAQVIRLIVERSDQLQQQVTELRSFIRAQERPQVGAAVVSKSIQQRALRKRSRKR
jgi:hypothetical protein